MKVENLSAPLAIAAIFCAGCASAVHTRTTANGVVEKTSIHTFLSTTAIKGFSESTRDGSGTNGYLRTVRVSDAGTQTEIEKLQGLGEAIARGATEGAAKGAKGGL